MDHIGLLRLRADFHLCVSDVGGRVASHHNVEAGPPQIVFFDDVSHGILWGHAEAMNSRGRGSR